MGFKKPKKFSIYAIQIVICVCLVSCAKYNNYSVYGIGECRPLFYVQESSFKLKKGRFTEKIRIKDILQTNGFKVMINDESDIQYHKDNDSIKVYFIEKRNDTIELLFRLYYKNDKNQIIPKRKFNNKTKRVIKILQKEMEENAR